MKTAIRILVALAISLGLVPGALAFDLLPNFKKKDSTSQAGKSPQEKVDDHLKPASEDNSNLRMKRRDEARKKRYHARKAAHEKRMAAANANKYTPDPAIKHRRYPKVGPW